MPRVLAIDYGTKRTGLAVTDELQIIGSGLTTVPTPELMDFLRDYIRKENVSTVLIGDPRQMNNQRSQSAGTIDAFATEFIKSFPNVKVVRVDERFTSKLAFQSMLDSRLKKSKRQDKSLLDEISATIMLQDYLTRKMI